MSQQTKNIWEFGFLISDLRFPIGPQGLGAPNLPQNPKFEIRNAFDIQNASGLLFAAHELDECKVLAPPSVSLPAFALNLNHTFSWRGVT